MHIQKTGTKTRKHRFGKANNYTRIYFNSDIDIPTTPIHIQYQKENCNGSIEYIRLQQDIENCNGDN